MMFADDDLDNQEDDHNMLSAFVDNQRHHPRQNEEPDPNHHALDVPPSQQDQGFHNNLANGLIEPHSLMISELFPSQTHNTIGGHQQVEHQ